MDLNETDLILRCQKGDQAALREIYERYREKVYRIAYGVVRQREDALEIVQDVFIKVFRTITLFEGKSRFYTFLYRITMNTAIDHVRKVKKIPRTVVQEEGGIQLSEELERGPDRMLLRKELEEKVKGAMEKLPADQKMAVVLREIEGLSYQEMAEAMECSVGTVMSRLHYGRKKMQDLLKGVEGDEDSLSVRIKSAGAIF
jgi:RNA polymerase sigma-70 factor (ECF subfamily)